MFGKYNFLSKSIFLVVKQYLSKQNIAIFLAILFHFCGAIGILFTDKKDWFINNTPLNLSLMALLLVWVQEAKNLAFFAFFGITFLVGMATEMVGVNTGKLFGNYHYGTVLGNKLNGVPYLIGINWFVIIFCTGTLITKLNDWVEDKYQEAGINMSPTLKKFSFLFDGAIIATSFDYGIEPVANHLHFWEWKDNLIPMYNYLCWFIISTLLLYIFKRLQFNKENQFAIHLLIIQYLFFTALEIYLP